MNRAPTHTRPTLETILALLEQVDAVRHALSPNEEDAIRDIEQRVRVRDTAPKIDVDDETLLRIMIRNVHIRDTMA